MAYKWWLLTTYKLGSSSKYTGVKVDGAIPTVFRASGFRWHNCCPFSTLSLAQPQEFEVWMFYRRSTYKWDILGLSNFLDIILQHPRSGAAAFFRNTFRKKKTGGRVVYFQFFGGGQNPCLILWQAHSRSIFKGCCCIHWYAYRMRI